LLKNLHISSDFPGINKSAIHKLVSVLANELNFSIGSLEINFITSDKIKELNKQYLNHNYSTDVLSFNYSGENSVLDAEIFISVQEARQNASKFKVKIEEENCRLVIHGILHLLGYDDIQKKNKIKMKLIENQLLNRFKFILLPDR
jgi:rRNA maturation RNase YbeY